MANATRQIKRAIQKRTTGIVRKTRSGARPWQTRRARVHK